MDRLSSDKLRTFTDQLEMFTIELEMSTGPLETSTIHLETFTYLWGCLQGNCECPQVKWNVYRLPGNIYSSRETFPIQLGMSTDQVGMFTGSMETSTDKPEHPQLT
jgi:hypothetical protein